MTHSDRPGRDREHGFPPRPRARPVNDRVDLVRVIDPREEAGKAVAERFETQWTPELGSLSDVDAVVLASATEAHYDLAQEILGQDKPMLVEKPVCNSFEQSPRRSSRCRQKQRPPADVRAAGALQPGGDDRAGAGAASRCT